MLEPKMLTAGRILLCSLAAAGCIEATSGDAGDGDGDGDGGSIVLTGDGDGDSAGDGDGDRAGDGDGDGDGDSAGDGDGDGSGVQTSGGPLCRRFVDHLFECGVLGAGRFGCSEPTDPGARCELDCYNEAACNELLGDFCGTGGGATADCLDTCAPLDFVCGSGETIPASWRCDGGTPDCADGSDEVGCAVTSFTCGDGSQIPLSYECDTDDDCPDASDEASCVGRLFVCANGDTIYASYECDADDDCGDGSDEVGCAALACP